MKFIDEINNTNKIADLGDNFEGWFAQIDFTVTPVQLYSTPIVTNLTALGILMTYHIGEVTLGDIYPIYDTIKNDSLFFVRDNQNNLRTVFIFNDVDGRHLISRAVNDPDRWYDCDIYSSTPL